MELESKRRCPGFRHCAVEKSSPGVYSVKGDPVPIQIIDTRELPEEENIWLAKLDNRLDQTGARKIISEINRLDKAVQIGAYINALYNANFAVMEEVSKMDDITPALDKTLENAGYVTRRMILAKAKIAQNALAQGIPPETVATITEMEIETVREIAELGNRPIN